MLLAPAKSCAEVGSVQLDLNFCGICSGKMLTLFTWRKTCTMKKEQIVSQNPRVMNGALVFAGTRVPVEILIQHLVAGDSLDVFLADFPTVAREQAIAYLKMTLEFADARVA